MCFSAAVFDWDNENVHLAQAANCGSNIVAIGNGTSSVPDGKSDCSLGSSVAANMGLMAAVAVVGAVLLF